MDRYFFEWLDQHGSRPWGVFDHREGYGHNYDNFERALAFCRDAATAELIVSALNAQDATRKEKSA